jgi:hypothetical protein
MPILSKEKQSKVRQAAAAAGGKVAAAAAGASAAQAASVKKVAVAAFNAEYEETMARMAAADAARERARKHGYRLPTLQGGARKTRKNKRKATRSRASRKNY